MPAATVVVIDRSPAVLELSEQALRDAGHRVLVTSDPFEALSAMRAVRIDLVIADATHLESFQRRPDAPRTVVIGDPDEVCDLERPFSLDELRSAVEAALADV